MATKKVKKEKKKPVNWMQGAPHKGREGSFTKICEKAGFSGPNQSCIDKFKHNSNKKIRGKALFAQAAKRAHH